MSILKSLTSAVLSPQGAAAAIGGGLGVAGSSITAAKSAEEAQRNREFQERMSSTAYQRAAEDLKAAGLNRILAFGSPASTPGGAVGQVPDFGQSLSSGASQGLGIGTSAQQIKTQAAQMDKLIEETGVIKSKAVKVALESKLWEKITPYVISSAGSLERLVKTLAAEAPQILKEIQDTAGVLKQGLKELVTGLFKPEIDSDNLWYLFPQSPLTIGKPNAKGN